MNETPVVELIRVSTDAQANGDKAGIPAQRTTNRDTCTRFHLHVVETVEAVESGATVVTSAAMARVLEAIRSGRAKGVVLAAQDRLFRPENWRDWGIYQVFAEAEALIYLPSGPLDVLSEAGFIQAGMGTMMAGLERRRIRERTMRAKDEMRRAGKLASGKPPYGLAYSRETGWSYTPHIEVVKAIFATFLGGERNYEALSERFGLHPTRIRTILRRPVYAGWLVFPSREQPEKHDLRGWPDIIPAAPDGAIRAETGLPPAVPLGDFLEAQRIIEQRSERRSLVRASATNHFLYRGMLQCSCSLPVYGLARRVRKEQGMAYWYACKSVKWGARGRCPNQHMTRHRVEAALDRIVQDRLVDAGLITAAIEAHNAALVTPPPVTDGLVRLRAELDARRARVLEAFFAGLITRAACDEQIKAIDAQLAGVRQPARAPRPAAIDRTAVRGFVRTLGRWRSLGWEGRRAILEALAPMFVLHRYTIEGVWLDIPEGGASRITTPEDIRLWIPLGIAA